MKMRCNIQCILCCVSVIFLFSYLSGCSPNDPLPPARIPFDMNTTGPTAGASATLDAQAAWLTQNDASVVIEGYADGVGDAGVYLAASQRFADATRRGLVERGVAANRLVMRAFGRTGIERCNALDSPIVEACTLTIVRDQGFTNQDGLMLYGASASYWVPPDAASSSISITLRQRIDGLGSVALSPDMTFAGAAFLLLDGAGLSIAKQDADPVGATPTVTVKDHSVAQLFTQSEWGSGGVVIDCDPSVTNCGKVHWTGPAPLQAQCVGEALEAFEAWLLDVVRASYSDQTRMAALQPACGVPDALFDQITANPSSGTYACANRGGLCRDWLINVPPHMPNVNSTVYLPDPNYLAGLPQCQGAPTEVSAFYDALLDHELAHHAAYQLAASTTYSGTITVQNVPVVATEFDVKAKGYQKGCIDHLREASSADHALIDADPPAEMQLLPAMCRDCGQSCQPSYNCPCNSTQYDDLTVCLGACQTSLGCFVDICAAQPIDPTCP